MKHFNVKQLPVVARSARFAMRGLWLFAAALAMVPGIAAAQSEAELAKKLANPISSLISVPFQYNYDSGLGDGDGEQSVINLQPVIPFSIGENWNMISRTIIPFVDRNDFGPGYGLRSGVGNITQNLFFSPKQPTRGGLVWGVGPVLQFPSVTNGIGTEQWGAGITGVVLKQNKGWTVGLLANTVWSISENDNYGQSTVSFLQPIVGYATKNGTSFTLNTESAYNWQTKDWSVPINFSVGKLIKVGGKPVQVAGGVRYWADGPDTGPDGWGARLVFTYLFPK